MPTRGSLVIIVLFWLGMTGWLFQRDIWPNIRPGDPPRFAIDLADEAHQRDRGVIRWTIHRDGKPIPNGKANSWVQYEEKDDTFQLATTIRHLDLNIGGILGIRLVRMK